MSLTQSKHKAILFDLDGTILDTRALVAASYLHTFKEVLEMEMSASEVMRDYGRPLRYTFARYAPPAKVEEMMQVYRDFNLEHHDAMAVLYPGGYEGLIKIKELGLPMGVVTSKKRPIAERGLRLHHLEDFFEILVCEEDTIEHKPEPEPLQFAARKLGLIPEEMIYVGDSPYDLMCANSAGAAAIAVAWSTFTAEELLELKPLLYVHDLNDIVKLFQ